MINKDLVLWTLLLCGYCLLITSVLCQEGCQPAEEGPAYIIECQIPRQVSTTQQYFWANRDNPLTGYCGCEPNKSCVCEDGYSATLQPSTMDYYSYPLTISNPLRNLSGTVFVCGNNDATVTYDSCDLSVFVKAKNPKCQVQDPGSTSNTDVVVTCQADDIFPGAACQFNKFTNNSILTNLTSGTTGVNIETGEKSCTLRVAGNSVGRGDHQFRVNMYPNSTEVSYGVTSEYATTIVKIDDPSVKLSNCPTDYIEEKKSATCKCTRTDHTFFPVNIKWRNNNGGTVSVSNQQPQSATLTFTATRGQAFTCSVTNSIQATGEVDYTPQVAYGPDSVDVTLEPPSQGTIDLCQDRVSFTAQCQVSPSSVVPSATYSYIVNTTSSVVPPTPSSGSTNTATVTVTQGGTYGVYYVVKNSKFPAIQAENSVSIVVREPPSAPIIEIFQPSRVSFTSGGILTVEEGEANVTCHVTGGYPQVTELRLSCGEDKPVTISNNQTQSVSFTRNMNGQSCSCMATHDSRCYSSNTTTYMLDVQYPPSIRTFSAGNIVDDTVEKGSNLTFDCEAEGNPLPGLSLQHDGVRGDVTGKVVNTTNVTTVTYNHIMDCLDTGVYTCTAQARGMKKNSTVEVYVLCPQQLESSQSQYEVHNAEINSTFDINISVYGYPRPSSLQLHGHKKDLQDADYNKSYTETSPPHGTVTLTFYSLTKEYFQNYTLNVTNDKGSLVYYFSISGDVGGTDDGDSLEIAAIVGGIAAAVVVILIIVLVVFIVRRNGNPCAKKGDSSRKAGQDEEEHVIPNDLYSGANSGEVVIDNSDLYSGNWNRKSNEVVIDNSDLYSGFSKPGSKEVVVDNSALYGKSDDFKETREALYKNYTDVTPSMTSATAVPVDMKAFNGAKQGGNSSYEDVEVGAKSSGPSVQPKPKVAVKPMTATKPTPAPKPGGPSTSGPQGAFAVQDDGGDQTYASVVKPVKPQAPKPQPANQRESDYFPDQSKKPEVPEKKYEQEESLTGQEGKKKEQKSGGDKKKKNKKADEIPMVPKGGAAGSSSHDNPYVNGGYADDDGNVYANATGARAAPNNSDNIRTNEGPNTGRYKNKDGLVYTTVELMPQPTGQRKPKIVEDKVNYSQITFDGKS